QREFEQTGAGEVGAIIGHAALISEGRVLGSGRWSLHNERKQQQPDTGQVIGFRFEPGKSPISCGRRGNESLISILLDYKWRLTTSSPTENGGNCWCESNFHRMRFISELRLNNHCLRRKKSFPTGGLIVMLLMPLAVEIGEVLVVQLPVARLEFCNRM